MRVAISLHRIGVVAVAGSDETNAPADAQSFQRAGIDSVVCPERALIARHGLRPVADDRHDAGFEDLRIKEGELGDQFQIAG